MIYKWQNRNNLYDLTKDIRAVVSYNFNIDVSIIKKLTTYYSKSSNNISRFKTILMYHALPDKDNKPSYVKHNYHTLHLIAWPIAKYVTGKLYKDHNFVYYDYLNFGIKLNDFRVNTFKGNINKNPVYLNTKNTILDEYEEWAKIYDNVSQKLQIILENTPQEKLTNKLVKDTIGRHIATLAHAKVYIEEYNHVIKFLKEEVEFDYSSISINDTTVFSIIRANNKSKYPNIIKNLIMMMIHVRNTQDNNMSKINISELYHAIPYDLNMYNRFIRSIFNFEDIEMYVLERVYDELSDYALRRNGPEHINDLVESYVDTVRTALKPKSQQDMIYAIGSNSYTIAKYYEYNWFLRYQYDSEDNSKKRFISMLLYIFFASHIHKNIGPFSCINVTTFAPTFIKWNWSLNKFMEHDMKFENNIYKYYVFKFTLLTFYTMIVSNIKMLMKLLFKMFRFITDATEQFGNLYQQVSKKDNVQEVYCLYNIHFLSSAHAIWNWEDDA